ncbi:CHASE3 domain-containing protein [Phenylobacterium sp. LH3H17]|uniref:sensor histidine kinase n=1 Tax=Phenylobacterium sp. LH3H17 TaxID=2903901 RepID=UPI0020C9B5F8|nr:CHASE3 domain-containing protein [Phenylobacterium sp. LH3H17]UTP39334.1 CHASE3 domain-containing protein [Phenylobacterium sp. LH3H17]
MARDPAEVSGSNRQAARERAFRLLAGTVAALFLTFASVGGVFFWYDHAARKVAHTHEVRNGIADVLQALTDSESAQRGYVLTGEQRFIEQIEDGRERAEAEVNAVDILTADNPQQQARIVTLRALMAKRLDVVDQVVAERRKGDAPAALSIILRGEGIAAMEGVRRIVTQLETEEARLLDQRARQTVLIRAGLIILLVGFALVLTFLFVKAQRELSLDREVEADTAERLRALLADRSLLLDEVNHRVKNSLQQIASVVRLQSRSVPDGPAREALDKTLDRIMAVGRVHEQLYKSGGQVGAFDAGHYAKALAHDLVDSLGREDVQLTTSVEAHVLDLKQAVPLALILNELVTNALKYGCPADRPCRIHVGFGTDGQDYRLSVSDDGVGLPKGFTSRSKKSLGMRAIEALARQLGGRLVVEQPEAGAAFAVVFPRSQ